LANRQTAVYFPNYIRTRLGVGYGTSGPTTAGATTDLFWRQAPSRKSDGREENSEYVTSRVESLLKSTSDIFHTAMDAGSGIIEERKSSNEQTDSAPPSFHNRPLLVPDV
jgi:hypothetical protein